MSDFIYPKKGRVVEGTVFQVAKNVIYVDLGAPTEGTIFAEHYDDPAPADLRKLVKVGDKISAKVTKVSEGDDSSVILLTRLPLIQDKRMRALEEAYQTKTAIDTEVKSVGEKGLVLSYAQKVELFLPYTLLDFELQDKKEQLVGTSLKVLIEEFKPHRNRPRLIATRKPIFEAVRQQQQEERLRLRSEELETIQTGDIIEGTVESMEAHAAFIRFGHVSGMLRISQVSHHRIDKIEDVLSLGDSVKVKVIKKEGNRLDLSIKALLPTPYEAYLKDHKVGDKVTGVIVSKLPFGVLVELARDVKGLLHKNEYSWNPKDNFDAYLKIGDEIETVILSKDAKNEKVALSRKVLERNPWAELKLKTGDIIDVRVESVTKDGIVVSYESVDGFMPANEAHNDSKVNIEDHYQVGDVIQAQVIDFSKERWILVLSVKRYLNRLERQEVEKYLAKETVEDTVTIGDLIEDLNKDENNK